MEKYQTIGPRFLALLIDSMILIPISFLGIILSSFSNQVKYSTIINILMSSVSVVYTVLMHNFYGRTLGKMAMKVKVLDISERPITFTQAVIRSLPQMLPVFITASLLLSDLSPENANANELLKSATNIAYILYSVWSVADIIVCFASAKKRALHDFLAGTVVVRTDGWSNLSINS